jgi:hypothetical protein
MSKSTDPVKLPAIFSGIQSKVDGSYKLTFNTRELSGSDAAVLLGMANKEAWVLVAPDEDVIDSVEVPTEKPDSLTPRKSHAARQRSVMFIYWKQQGGDKVLGSFDNWYGSVMERNIELWKAKLDGEDVS